MFHVGSDILIGGILVRDTQADLIRYDSFKGRQCVCHVNSNSFVSGHRLYLLLAVIFLVGEYKRAS